MLRAAGALPRAGERTRYMTGHLFGLTHRRSQSSPLAQISSCCGRVAACRYLTDHSLPTPEVRTPTGRSIRSRACYSEAPAAAKASPPSDLMTVRATPSRPRFYTAFQPRLTIGNAGDLYIHNHTLFLRGPFDDSHGLGFFNLREPFRRRQRRRACVVWIQRRRAGLYGNRN